MLKERLDTPIYVTPYEQLCIDFARDKITETEFNKRSAKFGHRIKRVIQKDVVCGTDTKYNKYNCRCNECTEAHNKMRQQAIYKKDLGDYGLNPKIPHGTASGYNYHKCRCEVCKQWGLMRGRDKRNRNRIS